MNGGVLPKSSADDWRNGTLEERLKHALVKGIGDYLEADLDEAAQQYDNPVKIIEGPLMDAMNTVGELFGSGKMFLPQVVKTARTMKKAVSILQPLIEASRSEGAQKAGKVLLATVKGDVHDIGKNIVKVVVQSHGFTVTDLGKDVPKETVLEAAQKESPNAVGLSALMTTTVDSMKETIEYLRANGITCPIIVGGAVMTPDIASAIGATYYSKDALETAHLMQEICSTK